MSLTKKQRKAQMDRENHQRRTWEARKDREIQKRRALEADVQASGTMDSVQIAQSPVAESSAMGADARDGLGATPSDETIDAPGFHYPTPPQPEHPGFVEAMTSGFMPIPDPFANIQGTETPLVPPPPPEVTPGSQFRAPPPAIPIDPLLLHMDVLRDHGIELEDRVAAERLLRRLGLWPDYLW
ncbi:hypothetical protein MMC07_003167 [Pseudocyphellaria aurata]|nr:hypothetical protein [Pseudocyphellaria aurata]